MPDQNNDTNPVQDDVAPVAEPASGVVADIIDRINDSKNILVALSKNPSVDEFSAAIGLSMYLDRIGKNATAIYSGGTPDVLEFLRPNERFERSADVLQDFVIALDKDKADHLRYKVDGDFVKIYITPYKTKVTGNDLDFSYGDFNVDLVFAIDVSNGTELDSALREHGRIMHDAVIVNVTTSAPGKFGEIEWSNQAASSISEMIADLLFAMEVKPEQDEATALLTGVVAATNSFSNARTTSDTMKVSSKLMEAGANQQLVAMHINTETDNELYTTNENNIDIVHDEELPAAETPVTEAPAEMPVVENPVVENPVVEEQPVVELPTFEAPVVETPVAEPVDGNLATEAPAMGGFIETPIEEAPMEEFSQVVEPVPDMLQTAQPEAESQAVFDTQGVTITPAAGSSDLVQPVNNGENFEFGATDDNGYGQMLEEALAEQGNEAVNPAAVNAPAAPSEPEINGVPVINYTPAADEILTPPPMPPVNLDVAPTPEEVAAVAAPEATVLPENPIMEPVPEAQPAMQPQVPEMPVMEPMPAFEQPVQEQPAAPVQQPAPQAYVAPDEDVSAFKIPGM